MSTHDPLNGKRVVVLGFGRQGRALARWLPKLGASVVVNDSRTAEEIQIVHDDFPGVEFVLGDHPAHVMNGANLVCISGGVPLDLPLLQVANRLGIPFTNDAQLFLERCAAPVIGITGSAGKTTTTTLVGDMLRRAGYTTWVGGNIGDVLLEVLDQIKPDHRVVMELSSFQLELMRQSPQVAAILNVTPNHLDRHVTMEAYLNAKANIMRYQGAHDVVVLGKDDPGSAALESLAAGELAWFSGASMVSAGTFLIGERIVAAGSSSYDAAPHVICNKNEIPLRGEHNVMNVLAACAIAGAVGLAADSPGIEPEIMRESIINFKAVPHRLEPVRELDGVIYVNDSIATAPERLNAALRSYEEPLVLLIGGADKDLPWQETLAMALKKSRHIIAFGKLGEKQVGDKVVKLMRMMNVDADLYTRVMNLEEAVERAREIAQPGDVVLMSPGGTSYDAYTNFEKRGEHFRDLVNDL